MITTTLAAGDLLTAIPSLWNDARIPLAIVLIFAAVGAAIGSIHKGFGSAAGKLLGGIALACIAISAVPLVMSMQETVNRHGNNVLTGQYGQ